MQVHTNQSILSVKAIVNLPVYVTGAYKKSLAKAVKKTVEDRQYRVVVVDAPNVRVSDFKELWTAAQVGA
jgi:hypothetical protein